MNEHDDYRQGDAEVRDIAAERAVLGGMMLDSRQVWDVSESVRPGDYYDPRHEQIHRAITSLAATNAPTDPLAVVDWLTTNGLLKGNLDVVYVHGLLEAIPVAASSTYYADIVRKVAERRRLAIAARQILESALAGSTTEGDLLEGARALVDDVASKRRAPLRRVSETMLDLVEDLESTPTYRRTPWLEIDRYLGGWRPGALYVVGARPGVGKTIVGIAAAAGLAQHGPVGYVTLEMPEPEIQRRLIASLGTVSLGALTSHQLTSSDWNGVRTAREAIEGLHLYVNDEASTMTDIAAFARSLHRMGGMGGLVVDYLQLMSGDNAENRQQEISGISRGLKRLALSLEVPIIALSQLNRQFTVRRGKQMGPVLSDLRESGAIEQDADVVILLDRDEAGRVDLAREDIRFSLAKNRHGKTGEVTLAWDGAHARVLSKKAAWRGPETLIPPPDEGIWQ